MSGGGGAWGSCGLRNLIFNANVVSFFFSHEIVVFVKEAQNWGGRDKFVP